MSVSGVTRAADPLYSVAQGAPVAARSDQEEADRSDQSDRAEAEAAEAVEQTED